MKEIKIQKGIPVPAHRSKYLRSKMKKGDSFVVPLAKRAHVTTSSYSWAKRNNKDWKFCSARLGDKVRIWRVK